MASYDYDTLFNLLVSSSELLASKAYDLMHDPATLDANEARSQLETLTNKQIDTIDLEASIMVTEGIISPNQKSEVMYKAFCQGVENSKAKGKDIDSLPRETRIVVNSVLATAISRTKAKWSKDNNRTEESDVKEKGVVRQQQDVVLENFATDKTKLKERPALPQPPEIKFPPVPASASPLVKAKQVRDSILSTLGDKPVYAVDGMSLDELIRLRAWKAAENKALRKEDKKARKLELKNVERDYDSGKIIGWGSALAQALSKRSFLGIAFSMFMSGFRNVETNSLVRKARLAKRLAQMEINRRYEDREIVRRQDLKGIDEAIKYNRSATDDSPWTPRARIPRYSRPYEGLSKEEKEALNFAQGEMSKAYGAYWTDPKHNPQPTMRDFRKLRDSRFEQIVQERANATERIVDGLKQDVGAKRDVDQKMQQKMEEILHKKRINPDKQKTVFPRTR